MTSDQGPVHVDFGSLTCAEPAGVRLATIGFWKNAKKHPLTNTVALAGLTIAGTLTPAELYTIPECERWQRGSNSGPAAGRSAPEPAAALCQRHQADARSQTPGLLEHQQPQPPDVGESSLRVGNTATFG